MQGHPSVADTLEQSAGLLRDNGEDEEAELMEARAEKKRETLAAKQWWRYEPDTRGPDTLIREMKTSLLVLILAATVLSSCGQPSEPTTSNVLLEREPLNHAPSTEIQNESRYADTEGNSVIIQNSYPRGGDYVSPGGKRYACFVFWSRVINESPCPLVLSLDFPANSLAILPSADSYLKLFLPPDTVTVDKLSMLNYGVDLQVFLDNNRNGANSKKQTLEPGEESLFCIIMLFVAPDGNGRVRTGLVFEGQDLFYRVNIEEQVDSAFVPCGRTRWADLGGSKVEIRVDDNGDGVFSSQRGVARHE